jgi:hypothetical protein
VTKRRADSSHPRLTAHLLRDWNSSREECRISGSRLRVDGACREAAAAETVHRLHKPVVRALRQDRPRMQKSRTKAVCDPPSRNVPCTYSWVSLCKFIDRCQHQAAKCRHFFRNYSKSRSTIWWLGAIIATSRRQAKHVRFLRESCPWFQISIPSRK